MNPNNQRVGGWKPFQTHSLEFDTREEGIPLLSRNPLNDTSDLTCFVCRVISVCRDRKRKNFVGEDGNTKKIRTESGVRIPATYKKNMYPLETLHLLRTDFTNKINACFCSN